MYIIVLISEDDGHLEGDPLLHGHVLLHQHFAVISPRCSVLAETRCLSVDWPPD